MLAHGCGARVRRDIGTVLASSLAMGAKDFTELICWQLATDLNRFVTAFLAKPNVARHRNFCEQLESAASSAPRNIAEGFGRYDHKEFAQFLKIAVGSIQETRSACPSAAAPLPQPSASCSRRQHQCPPASHAPIARSAHRSTFARPHLAPSAITGGATSTASISSPDRTLGPRSRAAARPAPPDRSPRRRASSGRGRTGRRVARRRRR